MHRQDQMVTCMLFEHAAITTDDKPYLAQSFSLFARSATSIKRIQMSDAYHGLGAVIEDEERQENARTENELKLIASQFEQKNVIGTPVNITTCTDVDGRPIDPVSDSISPLFRALVIFGVII